MKMKKVSKVTPMYSEQDLFLMGKEYSELSAQIKELEARKKSLSDKIKEGTENFGVKDSNGSSYLENDNFILGRVAKKSVKLNQEKAITMLENLGFEEAIDTVTTRVVNEDKLSNLIESGKISVNAIDEVTDVSVSYSVSVKAKETMPEVETTTLVAKGKK